MHVMCGVYIFFFIPVLVQLYPIPSSETHCQQPERIHLLHPLQLFYDQQTAPLLSGLTVFSETRTCIHTHGGHEQHCEYCYDISTFAIWVVTYHLWDLWMSQLPMYIIAPRKHTSTCSQEQGVETTTTNLQHKLIVYKLH